MTRRSKTVLFILAVLVVLAYAGMVAFSIQDDRRAAAFRFAAEEPRAVLEKITQSAKDKGGFTGSGVGLTIPDGAWPSLGPTRWTVTADGTVRGTAPERGLVVLLAPEMRDGKVAWKCSVEPARDFMPGTCGMIVRAYR